MKEESENVGRVRLSEADKRRCVKPKSSSLWRRRFKRHIAVDVECIEIYLFVLKMLFGFSAGRECILKRTFLFNDTYIGTL